MLSDDRESGKKSLQVRRVARDSEFAQCARLMAGSEPWITLGRNFDYSLRVIRDPDREVYAAFDGDRVRGFIVLCLTGAFVGYIQTIAVQPDERGNGLGTALIEFAEDLIFRTSPNVFLCVSSFNPRARKLYERLGYQYVGELTDFVVRGHSELLFRKTIGPRSEFKPA